MTDTTELLRATIALQENSIEMLENEIKRLRKYVLGDSQILMNHLALSQTVTFAGRVDLADYLGRIDVIVLTSINEAQPLVILEAGAAGIPAVATDVGACREMLLGSRHENPPLGAGGAITPLSNPTATANALVKLLSEREWYEQCSRNIRERVVRYYNKADLDQTYRNLYEHYRTAPEVTVCAGGSS